MKIGWRKITFRAMSGILVAVMISAILWTQKSSASRLQEFNYVWANALQVANPEYQIWSKGDVDRDLFSISATVEIESHSPATAHGVVDSVAEISENVLGRVGATPVPPNRMTRYLGKFMGGQGGSPEAKGEAVVQARTLKSRELATVIVELAAPLTEDELEAMGDFSMLEWKRFFLSGSQASTGKPVYWWPGKGGCSATRLVDPQCSNQSAVSQFQQWTHNLSDDDQGDLAKLGLDLKVLRDAAAKGRIFGFIANTFSQDQVLDLLSRPEVRTVHIVERWVEEE
ncbi:hypothetical protein [Nonomuraea sp. 10N515B]|uniref:hypothetical protein n=1 Tax=Nonomuraea sp. 10N515B TaxID=3457422 RepID=UPI003FCDCB1F